MKERFEINDKVSIIYPSLKGKIGIVKNIDEDGLYEVLIIDPVNNPNNVLNIFTNEELTQAE